LRKHSRARHLTKPTADESFISPTESAGPEIIISCCQAAGGSSLINGNRSTRSRMRPFAFPKSHDAKGVEFPANNAIFIGARPMLVGG
jgi:hypothetical protein